MGMYDHLYINADKLPVSDEEKKIIARENPDWQTKDFECILTDIYITDEGELIIERFTYGWDETKENGFGTIGVLTKENLIKETIPYHGYINFYSYVRGYWYEFNAKFTDGKLVSIEGGKENK